MASLANWADEIRESRPETAPWHYINIPPEADSLHLKIDCPDKNCVTVKAREFVGVVRLGLKDKEERLDALRFLIHQMGDLHQPLHAGLASDHGGNDIKVVFHGEETNLHRFWDSAILDEHISDEDAFVEQALKEMSFEEEKSWSRGHLTDWTWESRELARTFAYGALAKGDPKVIDDAYDDKAWDITREQLVKSGVRLAMIMNEMWGY